MKKRKPVRNPKPITRPAAAPGPETNRRIANKPYKPARARTFERRADGLGVVPFATVPLDLPGPHAYELDPDRLDDDAPERDE